MGACCTPSRGPRAAGTPPVVGGGAARAPAVGLVSVPGGIGLLGNDDPAFPEEAPVRQVRLEGFRIGACAVRNDEFAEFVAATGYRSTAETFGWSFVFAGLLPDDFPPTRGVAAAPWWREVPGADWSHPEGPQSDVAGRGDHPVVHVSWADAEAYAAYRGARLPTEDEWEHAARGGLVGQDFPWGAELEPGGRHAMNVWQGSFPSDNTRADGYAGTCPVDAFAPNAFGLFNTTGNVWEWAGAGAGGRMGRQPRRLVLVSRLLLPPLPGVGSPAPQSRLHDRQPGVSARCGRGRGRGCAAVGGG